MTAILKFFANPWVINLLFSAGILVWGMASERAYESQISTLETQNTALSATISGLQQEKTKALIMHNQALSELAIKLNKALALNDSLSRANTEKLSALTAENKVLKRRIYNEIQNVDGNSCGLSPIGLQLYHSGLGYPASDDLSNYPGAIIAATGQASATVTGLSEADLLAHSTDYGTYCRSLEAKLNGIRTWSEAQK